MTIPDLIGFLIAKLEAQLAGVAPRIAQAAGERSSAHEPHYGEKAGEEARGTAAGPDFAQGANHSIGVGMVNALVPGAGALRELWVVANSVHGGLQNAVLPGLGVLGHEEHIAAALFADLVDELVKAGGAGEVDVGVGFDAVAIAAGDQQHVPALGEAPDGAVFFPIAQAVEFEGMEVGAIFLEEFVHQEFVLILADAVEVPERVV